MWSFQFQQHSTYIKYVHEIVPKFCCMKNINLGNKKIIRKNFKPPSVAIMKIIKILKWA